jgi:aspartate racemase
MVGGVGPESTVDYYRLLISSYRERTEDDSYPEILINSVNLRKLVRMMNANDLSGLTDWMIAEVQKLANAGAEIGLIASNTPHIVFDGVSSRSPIPLVSIVEATCEAARVMQLKKLGLFGSGFTMKSDFYPKVFAKLGMELVTPEPAEQAWIHERYMDELANGIFRTETRDRFVAIARRMKAENGIQALILGGTEIPLILRNAPDCGMPFLDTSEIHVNAVMARACA